MVMQIKLIVVVVVVAFNGKPLILILYKMRYILWVVVLLEAVTSPNMVSILDFIKH